jgi:hypothetical protein
MNKILTLLALSALSATVMADQGNEVQLKTLDTTQYCYYANQSFKPGDINKAAVTQVCAKTNSGLVWLTVDLKKSVEI